MDVPERAGARSDRHRVLSEGGEWKCEPSFPLLPAVPLDRCEQSPGILKSRMAPNQVAEFADGAIRVASLL